MSLLTETTFKPMKINDCFLLKNISRQKKAIQAQKKKMTYNYIRNNIRTYIQLYQ